MNIAFIHIGLPKTATTYMQGTWRADSKYCISHNGTYKLTEEVRRAVAEEVKEYTVTESIHLDQQYLNSQQLIISQEGFSSAYLNEIQNQRKIPQFFDAMSRVLSPYASKTPNILIISRSPISWIKSVHGQSVKQGESNNLNEFLVNQEQFIIHSLNLKYLVSCYERFFSNVLVVPYEFFKENEKAFWDKISTEFNIKTPEIGTKEKVNAAFENEKVQLLARLNKISNYMMNAIENSLTYHDENEKEMILKNQKIYGKWTNRRFVEHASSKDLTELNELLKIDENKIINNDMMLSETLFKNIQDNYISALEGRIDSKYLESYKMELLDFKK